MWIQKPPLLDIVSVCWFSALVIMHCWFHSCERWQKHLVTILQRWESWETIGNDCTTTVIPSPLPRVVTVRLRQAALASSWKHDPTAFLQRPTVNNSSTTRSTRPWSLLPGRKVQYQFVLFFHLLPRCIPWLDWILPVCISLWIFLII